MRAFLSFALFAYLSIVHAKIGPSPTPSAAGSWTGPPGSYGPPQTHNASFVPDHVLRMTHENVTVGCQSRASTLFNGTTPGPELRLKPGQTSWIRVYNDMADYNATVVRDMSDRTLESSTD